MTFWEAPTKGNDMELTFEKEDLSKAIQILQGVTTGRNTLPILSNILIRAGNGQIEVAATDLEVGIRLKVLGQIQGRFT